MSSKSPELKAMEKRIKEEHKHAQEAARRDRAKAVVDAAIYIGDFRIMNAEAEIMLKAALEKLSDSSKYVVSVDKSFFDRNISDNFALVCEELQQYGVITAYMLLGTYAQLTLSEAGKMYFQNKTKVEMKVVEEKALDSDRNQIFISHRTVDAPIADMIKDFLVNTGIPNDKVFCSSLPGNDVNEKISPEVKQRLQKSIINILILSKDYYQSAYCLNEAGVAWYLDEAVAVPIGLPEINHTNMIGFLNNDYKLRRLDNDADISYLYDIAQEKLHANSVKHGVITRETTKLKERYTQYIESRCDNQQTDENETENTLTDSIGKDEGVLLVYAASDPAGQIMMIRTVTQTAPSISAGKYGFVSEDTAREGTRWKAAVEKLERFGLIEAVGYKREVFTVTYQGFKVAEQTKDKWGIDTDKSPDEYLD